MQFDGFSVFLNDAVHISACTRSVGVVADGKQVDKLRVVVFIRFLDIFHPFFVAYISVEGNVVLGQHGVVAARHIGVFARGTAGEQKQNGYKKRGM
jgi:hypothetical protein